MHSGGSRPRASPRFVVPGGRLILRYDSIPLLERLPDSDHAFGSSLRHLVVERSQRMDALNRVADCWIDEYQDAVERLARHAERFCRDHYRLAQIVAHDASCLLARNS